MISIWILLWNQPTPVCRCTVLGQEFVKSFCNPLSSPHEGDLQRGVQGTCFVFYEKEMSSSRFCHMSERRTKYYLDYCSRVIVLQ